MFLASQLLKHMLQHYLTWDSMRSRTGNFPILFYWEVRVWTVRWKTRFHKLVSLLDYFYSFCYYFLFVWKTMYSFFNLFFFFLKLLTKNLGPSHSINKTVTELNTKNVWLSDHYLASWILVYNKQHELNPAIIYNILQPCPLMLFFTWETSCSQEGIISYNRWGKCSCV